MKSTLRISLAALLTAALLSGCAASPASSTSPPAPSSTAPISSTAPVSSSEAPAKASLALSYDPAFMQCTIACDCAYVDSAGTLHYYPEFLKTGDLNYGYEPGAPVDTTAAPDGLTGVRSVYRTWGMVYVLMQDGTVRGVSLHMQEPGDEKTDDATEILRTITSWRNIQVLYPVMGGGDSYPIAMGAAAFPLNHLDNDIFRLRTFHNGDYAQTDPNVNPIVLQLCCGQSEAVLCDDGHVYTYAAGKTQPYISKWENITQIAMQGATLIALQSDGVLQQIYWDETARPNDVIRTDFPVVPEIYCTDIARLFDCGVTGGKDDSGIAFIQLTNGTLYDCANQKSLGMHPPIDQIFLGKYGIPSALTQDGKIIRLTEKADDTPDFTDWLQTRETAPATVGRK